MFEVFLANISLIMQYILVLSEQQRRREMRGGGGRASPCTAQKNANFAGKLYFVPLCSKSCIIIHTSISNIK